VCDGSIAAANRLHAACSSVPPATGVSHPQMPKELNVVS
jgi:hypothetical protein